MIEGKFNRLLAKSKDCDAISDVVYKSLYVSGASPGILNGLPKMHTPVFSSNFQFSIIFSAINTPCYKLAKYLVPLLSELSTNHFTEDNSYSFVKNLNSLIANGDFFMPSYYVKDISTNVLLSGTINIALNFLSFPNIIPYLPFKVSLINVFKTYLTWLSVTHFF